MAQRTITLLTSDISGKELPQGEGRTVVVGLDGVNYEVDLSSKEVEKLQSIMSPYLEAGRRLGKGGVPIKRTTVPPKRHDLEEIRKWAREEGIRVSDRGRVAKNIVEKYDQRLGG